MEVDRHQAQDADLRHFAASALIAGGASVKQVQMILDHATAAVTLGVYAHLWPVTTTEVESF